MGFVLEGLSHVPSMKRAMLCGGIYKSPLQFCRIVGLERRGAIGLACGACTKHEGRKRLFSRTSAVEQLPRTQALGQRIRQSARFMLGLRGLVDQRIAHRSFRLTARMVNVFERTLRFKGIFEVKTRSLWHHRKHDLGRGSRRPETHPRRRFQA